MSPGTSKIKLSTR